RSVGRPPRRGRARAPADRSRTEVRGPRGALSRPRAYRRLARRPRAPGRRRRSARARAAVRSRRRLTAAQPMAVDLAPLFVPRRVAVLGASRSPEKLGHRLLQNLLGTGFDGEVLPVNPSGDTILGRPSVVGV